MRLVEDKQLLREFRAGDQRTMATVFNHYSDDVTRYPRGGFGFSSDASRIYFKGIGDRHDLRDVLAETFRNAFEERARLRYSGLSPFGGYLRTIARNLVIDRLRSKSNKWVSLEGDAAEEAERQQGTQASAEDEAQRGEVVQLMHGFLDELDDDQRRFVHLRCEEGLPQRDVAGKMGKTGRWVRSAELDIRKRIVKHLRRTGYGKNGDN